MPRCHAEHHTGSPGKRRSEDFIVSQLNPHNESFSGKLLGVVGNPDRGQTHLLYWQRWGYEQSSVIVVDNDRITFEALHASSIASAVQVEYASLADAMRRWGRDITAVDADVVGTYGKTQEEIVELAMQYHIPRIALTFTTRGQGPYFQQLCWQHGLEKHPAQQANGRILTPVGIYKGRPYLRKPRYLACELVPKRLEYLVRGTDFAISRYFYYRGVGNTGMASICLYDKNQGDKHVKSCTANAARISTLGFVYTGEKGQLQDGCLSTMR